MFCLTRLIFVNIGSMHLCMRMCVVIVCVCVCGVITVSAQMEDSMKRAGADRSVPSMPLIT